LRPSTLVFLLECFPDLRSPTPPFSSARAFAHPFESFPFFRVASQMPCSSFEGASPWLSALAQSRKVKSFFLLLPRRIRRFPIFTRFSFSLVVRRSLMIFPKLPRNKCQCVVVPLYAVTFFALPWSLSCYSYLLPFSVEIKEIEKEYPYRPRRQRILPPLLRFGEALSLRLTPDPPPLRTRVFSRRILRPSSTPTAPRRLVPFAPHQDPPVPENRPSLPSAAIGSPRRIVAREGPPRPAEKVGSPFLHPFHFSDLFCEASNRFLAPSS